MTIATTTQRYFALAHFLSPTLIEINISIRFDFITNKLYISVNICRVKIYTKYRQMRDSKFVASLY